jgi:4-coumarate--CoA ligase
MRMQTSDIILGVLPFYHIYGITCLMGMPLLQGAALVTLPKFEPQSFLTAIQRHRTGYLFVVPPIIAFLAKHPSVAAADLSSVRTIFSGAAPLDGDTQKAVEARLPRAIVRQGYGMTESSPVTHAARTGGLVRPGSIGPPIALTESRVVSVETGAALPAGRDNVGEIQVRGPQVMLGYLNNEAATRATLLPGGWLRTGDLGYVDADGYYFIVDRLKELIKCKGFQVAPAELEGLLLSHPLIYDAAVVPRPDERAGEVPVAFVVTKAALLRAMGNAAGADALPPVTVSMVQEHIAGKVAEYKRLADVVFVDTIPKNPSGKILRRVLRDKLLADIAAAKKA